MSKQIVHNLTFQNLVPSAHLKKKNCDELSLTAGLTSAVGNRGMRKTRAVILSNAISDQPNPIGCLSVRDEPNPISAPSS